MDNNEPEDEKEANPLANFFGIEAVDDETPPSMTKALTTSNVQNEIDQDFELARTNITNAIAVTADALEDIARIAKQMEQPRGYDSLSTMLAQFVRANKTLLELHRDRQDVDAVAAPQTVTNNTIIMTTAEMQKHISDMRKELDEGNEGIDAEDSSESKAD